MVRVMGYFSIPLWCQSMKLKKKVWRIFHVGETNFLKNSLFHLFFLI